MIEKNYTDFRRNNYGQNYWVDRVNDNILEIMKSYNNVDGQDVLIFIPDTRFKNECNYIRDTFGKFGWYINVKRYNGDESRFITQDRDPNHPSETDLDDVNPDYTITAKSVAELTTDFHSILEEIMGRTI